MITHTLLWKETFILLCNASKPLDVPLISSSIFLGYHGSNGPWKVTKLGSTPELQEMYLNASQEIGQKVLLDVNNAEQEGNLTFKVELGGFSRIIFGIYSDHGYLDTLDNPLGPP